MTREEFGDRVNAFRVSKNLTQCDMSSKIGLSRASISNIERGQQVVTLDTIQKIAGVLGMTDQELLYTAEAPKVRSRNSGEIKVLTVLLAEAREALQLVWNEMGELNVREDLSNLTREKAMSVLRNVSTQKFDINTNEHGQ